MTSSIEINGSDSLNYLLHGQDLLLEFHFPRAWFVSVYYNQVPNGQLFRKSPAFFWQRYFLFRNKGAFSSKINGFYPTLRITCWSPFPRRIVIPLKINKLKLSNPLPKSNLKLSYIRPKFILHPVREPKQMTGLSINIPSFVVDLSLLPSSQCVFETSFQTFKNNLTTNPS